MSQFSVCPDPSMFSDDGGWEYDEPEPEEPAELPAHWDEAAEGDMRYDIAEEQRLFPAPEIAIPNLHPVGVQVEMTAPEFYAPGDGGGMIIRTLGAECKQETGDEPEEELEVEPPTRGRR